MGIKMAPLRALLLSWVLSVGFVNATTSDSSGSPPPTPTSSTASSPPPTASSTSSTSSSTSTGSAVSTPGAQTPNNLQLGAVRAQQQDVSVANQLRLKQMLEDRILIEQLGTQVLECGLKLDGHSWDDLEAGGGERVAHDCGFAALLVSASGTGPDKLDDIAEKLGMNEAAVTLAKSKNKPPGFMKTILSISSNALAVFFTLNLALAYMKRGSFFRASGGPPSPATPRSPSSPRSPRSPGRSSGTESFYNVYELLSVPEETGLRLLIKMCGMVNAPSRFHRSRINPVHSTAHPDSLMALVCDASMALLISIRTDFELYMEELNRHRIGVEANVDPAANAMRVLSKTCNQKSPTCTFQTSVLSKTGQAGSAESNATLQDAFQFVTGLGLVPRLGSQVNVPANEQGLHVPLFVPKRFTQVYTRIFWYDSRRIAAKNRRSQIREGVMKELKRLNGRLRPSKKEGYSMYQKGSHGVQERRHLLESFTKSFRFSEGTSAQPQSILTKFETFYVTKKMTKRNQKRQSMTMYALRTRASSEFSLSQGIAQMWDNALFQMLLLSRGKNPVSNLLKDRRKFQRTSRIVRMIKSEWTPNILKKALGALGSKDDAEETLRNVLKPSLIEEITKPFTWITHSSALSDINAHHKFFQDVVNKPLEKQSQMEVHTQPNLQVLDDAIKMWAHWGYSDAQLKMVADGKAPYSDSEDIPAPDMKRWDEQLNMRVAGGLQAAAKHPYARSSLLSGDDRATLLEESRRNLETNRQQTLFLGRIAPSMRPRNRLTKILSGLWSLISAPKKDFSVWFGVVADMNRILLIVKELRRAASLMKGSTASKVSGAFLRIVESEVKRVAAMERRTAGFSYNFPKPRFSSTLTSNKGFLFIRPGYAHLRPEDRDREFQLSMCATHCMSMWRFIMTFVYGVLENPQKMEGYEEKYRASNELTNLDNPHYVNQFRASLNIQNYYFENIFDKQTKKELAKMKYGAGAQASFSFKFAAMALSETGYICTGAVLAYQGPFMGNYINKMIKKQHEARKAAFLAMLTLGFFTVYTVLSSMSIAKQVVNAGAPPPIQCFESLIEKKTRCMKTVSTVISDRATTAVKDALTVGLFAGLAPYFVFPMMAYSVWQVLKAKFTVLLQFEVSVQHMFSRLWRFAKKKLFFMRKMKGKLALRKMEKTAKDKFDQAKKDSGETPEGDDYSKSVLDADSDFAHLGFGTADEQAELDEQWSAFMVGKTQFLRDFDTGYGLSPQFFWSTAQQCAAR